MGLLDDVLGSAVPGGNLAKPLMVGLAALLGARAVGSGLGGLLGGTGAAPQTPPIPSPTPTAAPGQPQGGLLGGLSSFAAKLSAKRSRRRDQFVDRAWTEPADRAGSTSSGARPRGGEQSLSSDRFAAGPTAVGVGSRPSEYR